MQASGQERRRRGSPNRHRGTAGVRVSDARLRHHAQQTLCPAAAGLHDSRRNVEARESTRGDPEDAAGRAGRAIQGPSARDALRVHGQSVLLRPGARPDRSLARGRVAQEEQGAADPPPGRFRPAVRPWGRIASSPSDRNLNQNTNLSCIPVG